MRRHVDFRGGFLCNDKIKRTGHTAAGYDDFSEACASHYAVVITHAETARRDAFTTTSVTFDAMLFEYRLNV
jgi:hypothetical protein